MDEGLAWWNEEFWITVTITFTSVAVTIGLTVWISWWVLNKQLRAERESQTVQRSQQLEDIKHGFERDRRIRQAEGLAGCLEETSARLIHMGYHVQSDSNQYESQNEALSQCVQSVRDHDYRLAYNEALFTSVSLLLNTVSVWVQAYHRMSKPVTPEFMERWRGGGYELAGQFDRLRESLPYWEDSGVLAMPRLQETYDRIAAL